MRARIKNLLIIICLSMILSGIAFIDVKASNMTISNEGLDLIKSFEGCRLTAYKPVSSEQYYTIGWGHYGPDVFAGMTITQTRADEMLVSDMVRYNNYVNTFLEKYNISVNQSQFDALVSFTYNCGNVWVSTPTFQLKTYLINGVQNYSDQQIRIAFTNWNKDGNGNVLAGLTRRRNAEADLFLNNGGGDVCNCSDNYAGNYKVTTESQPLNMRSGHGSSYGIVTSIPSGAQVYVSKSDGNWAHVEYNGYSGFCSMEYLQKIEYDIRIECWFSNTGLGDKIDKMRKLGDLYLCYRIYDAKSGKNWNELENKSYSVKETIYKPDGSEVYSYQYGNSDSNWIKITPNQIGQYTGKVELTGDRTGTVSCSVNVQDAKIGFKSWCSDTKMGNEKDSVALNDSIYLCYKVYDQYSDVLLNDMPEYHITYSVMETIYKPDGSEYFSYTYDQSDNNWIRVTANQVGKYRVVVAITLNGQTIEQERTIIVSGNQYTVTYDSLGEIDSPVLGSPDAQKKMEGQTLALSSATPIKHISIKYDANGGNVTNDRKSFFMQFNNWNTKVDGTGTSYKAGASYTRDEDVTLYAQYAYPLVGTLEVPTREGYEFEGWYIQSSDAMNGTKLTSVMELKKSVNVVARWKAKEVAATDGIISADCVSGAVGSTVAVPIRLEKNPGIIAIQCGLSYDASKLKLVRVEGAGLLDSSALSTDYTTMPYILSFGDGLNDTNILETGTLAVAYFEILPSFKEGNTEIGLTFDSAYDKDVNDVIFTAKNGNIEVKKYVPGDVNGDGQVKLNDAILLRRYVAGWSVTIDAAAADVNGDGQVKLNDAILLRRYVAGWNIELK